MAGSGLKKGVKSKKHERQGSRGMGKGQMKELRGRKKGGGARGIAGGGCLNIVAMHTGNTAVKEYEVTMSLNITWKLYCQSVKHVSPIIVYLFHF